MKFNAVAGRELPLGYTYILFRKHSIIAVAGRELPLGYTEIAKS